MTRRNDAVLREVLATYATVNDNLDSLTHEEVRRAIDLEFDGDARWTVIVRLVRRLGRLDVASALQEARVRYRRIKKRVDDRAGAP